MDYSIGEFSEICGLGIHTLRYYEHETKLDEKISFYQQKIERSRESRF